MATKPEALSCAIVHDLLPAYLEGACAAQTGALLQAHLQACEKCEALCDALRAPDAAVQKRPVDALRGIRKRRRRLAALIALGVLAVLLAGVYVLAGVNHSLPAGDLSVRRIGVLSNGTAVLELEKNGFAGENAVLSSYGLNTMLCLPDGTGAVTPERLAALGVSFDLEMGDYVQTHADGSTTALGDAGLRALFPGAYWDIGLIVEYQYRLLDTVFATRAASNSDVVRIALPEDFDISRDRITQVVCCEGSKDTVIWRAGEEETP